jgi:hypothetical protein
MSYEPYQRGEQFFHRQRADFSQIERVANRPDFLAKKLLFRNADLPKFQTFPELRSFIENGVKTLEHYVGKYLPPHYLTYSGPKTNLASDKEAYIFIKEIKAVPLDYEKRLAFAQQIDDFIEQSCRCYLENYNSLTERGPLPDIQYQNFVYGTLDQGPASAYFVDLFPVMNVWDPWDFKGKVDQITANFVGIYDFPKSRKVIEQLTNLTNN